MTLSVASIAAILLNGCTAITVKGESSQHTIEGDQPASSDRLSENRNARPATSEPRDRAGTSTDAPSARNFTNAQARTGRETHSEPLPPRTPFHELVDAWTSPDSPFGDPATLHGAGDNTWFDGYRGIDVSPTAAGGNGGQWPPVVVPNWARGQAGQPDTLTLDVVEPEWPSTPAVDLDPASGLPDLIRVQGSFLVGAAKWMHEEAVEEWMSGARTDLTDADRVPVYWVVGYQMFIPADYGLSGESEQAGRALVIAGNGRRPFPDAVNPPWMAPVTTRREFRDRMAVDLARRLRVPVMYLTQYPVDTRETRANEFGAAGNYTYVLGYTSEGKVYTVNWALENGTFRDHPQYLFGATYVRAVTLLNAFFNPERHGALDWSPWHEIVELRSQAGLADTNPSGSRDLGTEIDDVIIHGGSKRANAALIAGLADRRITGVIANGMAYFNGERMAHRQLDEMWDQREAPRDGTPEGRGGNGLAPDPDQARPESSVSVATDRIRAHSKGTARTFAPYYEVSTILHDAGGFPVAPVHFYHTAGAQDPFWPLLTWRDWFEEGEYPNDGTARQYLDLDPFATHPPTYVDFTQKAASYVQHLWDDRPMPEMRIADLHYVIPIEDETPEAGVVPLRVTGELRIPRSSTWQIASLQEEGDARFDDITMTLALGLRPQSASMSRGMWSENPPPARQWPEGVTRRMTPWWEIPPVPGSMRVIDDPSHPDEIVIRADFIAASDAYANTRPADPANSPWFPLGFEKAFADGLRLNGIPEDFHTAIYVRGAVAHTPDLSGSSMTTASHNPDWVLRSSTPVVYLPPWKAHRHDPANAGRGDEEGG